MKKITIKNWSKDDRPREKLILQGPSCLSNAELLAILLQTGNIESSAVDLAKQILDSVGNNLLELSVKNVNYFVQQFKGIGQAKAVTMVAAMELARRRHESKALERLKVRDSHSAFQIFFKELCDLNHEEFWVLLINSSGQVIEKKRVSEGGVSKTVVDIKKVLKYALDVNAVGLVLGHNHPSGNLLPSVEDLALTKRILESAKLLDIQVMDHLILKDNRYYSFADDGVI